METIDYEEYAKFRRYLHTIPELKLDCFKTKEALLEKMKSIKKDIVVVHYAKTGFTVDIAGKGEPSGNSKTIMIRTDMDGLPILEKTGVEYASTHTGMMHACGHDGHMTVVVATFEYFISRLDSVPSDFTVRFLFQPAEEGGPGAKQMIEEGAIDGVDEVYGLHNMTLFKVGELGLIEGPIMARIDVFKIFIKGKGGHGSTPHKCNSPLEGAVKLHNLLTSIVSNEVDSKIPSVLSIGKLTSGSTFNVIPETAEIAGTVRTLSNEAGETIVTKIRKSCEAIASLSGLEIECDIELVARTTTNSKESFEIANKVLSKYFPVSSVDLPVMASEDFAFFLEERPGVFFMLGARDENHKEYLHTDKYNYNDASTPFGVEAFTRLIEDRANIKLI